MAGQDQPGAGVDSGCRQKAVAGKARGFGKSVRGMRPAPFKHAAGMPEPRRKRRDARGLPGGPGAQAVVDGQDNEARRIGERGKVTAEHGQKRNRIAAAGHGDADRAFTRKGEG